jgi:cell division protein FtsL
MCSAAPLQVQSQIEDLRRQLAQEQQLRLAAQRELEELSRQGGTGTRRMDC